MTAPSAEGISYLRARPKDGARLAALRSPFGDLRPIVHLTLYGIQRWQVAAALSAAVTITKPQETAPNAQAEPTKKKQTRQTPAALRERGAGGEALLSEKRPLPQNLPPKASFREGARGRGLFYRKAPSLAIIITHSRIQSFIIASQRAMDDEIPNLEVLRNPPS